MLDFDLAELYQVETKRLKEAVRRNIERFEGDDFMFVLSEKEYEILSLMLKYRGKIFSVQNIYESVWQEPFFNNSANTVMVHIRKLRLKIEKNPQKPQIIQTVWGKGYRIE